MAANPKGYRVGPTGMGATRRHKKALLTDLKAMDEGKLGLSDAEKSQGQRSAQAAAGRQVGQLSGQLNQAAMAGGGGGLSGDLRQQARDVGQAAAEAGAQASAQQDALSAQLAAQREKEIKARLERQYDRARENRQAVANTVGTVAQMGVGLAFNPTAVASLQKFMPFTTSVEKTGAAPSVAATAVPAAAPSTANGAGGTEWDYLAETMRRRAYDERRGAWEAAGSPAAYGG